MDNKRTTIYLGENDRQAIAEIKKKYGVSSDSDAIRLALRLAASGDAKSVKFEIRRERKTKEQ